MWRERERRRRNGGKQQAAAASQQRERRRQIVGMGASGSVQPFELGDEVLLADGIDEHNGLKAGEYVTVTHVPDTRPGKVNAYKLQRSDGKDVKGVFEPEELVKALPPTVDLLDCRKIAGERFDQMAFNHFQDEFGLVTREQLLDKASHDKAAILELAADSRSKQRHEGTGCHRVGVGLKYSSEAIRADRHVVLEAVKQAGQSLQDASAELRADKEVVMVAMKQNMKSLKFASPELKRDQEIIMYALEADPAILRYADPVVFEDRAFMEECVSETWLALEYAPEEMRNDKAFVMIAARQNNAALKWATIEVRQQMGIEHA